MMFAGYYTAWLMFSRCFHIVSLYVYITMGRYAEPDAVSSNHQNKKPKAVSDGVIPRAPSWLNEKAKKIYKETAKEIVSLGVAGRCDANVLAIYAMQLERLIVISQQTDRELPAERLLNDLTTQTLSLTKELGISPSSRAKMRTATPPADTSIDDLFEDEDGK